MKLFFKKETHKARYLDPADEFQEKVVRIELRTDLFTGRKARVLTQRWRFPETSIDGLTISTSKEGCPFCPDKIETATPKFPSYFIPKERIRCGGATLVPNAFPYSKYNAVCVLSKEHYLSLKEFPPETLFDAFKACLGYITDIRRLDKRVAFASINWNYMPAAGGGIIHPHFQVVVDETPTKFHDRLVDASSNYHRRLGRTYWADLISYEERERARHIFRCGEITFLTSYCPAGMVGEVLVIFERAGTLDQAREEDWRCFSDGLAKILSCFHRMHFGSLNMTLFVNLDRSAHFLAQARIIPRMSISPLAISDVNYFEKGHDEIIAIISPEELANNIKSLLTDELNHRGDRFEPEPSFE